MATVASWQTTISTGLSATGVGFTVMVKLMGVPVQPLAAGVTEIVAMTGAVPLFTAVKAGMGPVPVDARPIDDRELVQVKDVPLTGPAKANSEIASLLHQFWFATLFTVGIGWMVRVTNVLEELSHPVASFLAAA